MNLEQKVLLSLLRMVINGDDSALPKGEWDWNALALEARQQSVLLTIFGAVSKMKQSIPEDIFKRQFNRCYAMLAANTRVSVGQKHLVALLEQNRFPYAVIKGETAASYYPKPELRNLGDVDFLIDPKDEERITELLIAEGFSVSHETDTRHRVFSKSDLRLEMHFKAAGVPSGIVGQKVDAFMESLFSDFQYADNGVGRFKVPSQRHHGLILLLHMQHHMLDGGIGLRHLCDWACFVNQTAEALFWNDSLLPFLKEIGLLYYAAVMTKTCSLYLGTNCPSWAMPVAETVCEEILEDILAGGNFGRKDILRKGSGILISKHEAGKEGRNKFHSILLTMHRSVLAKHPQTRNHILLYILFFLYRTARYVVMVLFGKRISVLESVGQANERKELYDQLHIFEIVEGKKTD